MSTNKRRERNPSGKKQLSDTLKRILMTREIKMNTYSEKKNDNEDELHYTKDGRRSFQ